MNSNTSTALESYLSKFDESAWLSVLEEVLPAIHEVDRNAVQIWFRFYPLGLFRYLQSAEDVDATVRGMVILGDYQLKNQIDTSHKFLFGHRYWKTVKAAIEAEAVVFSDATPPLAEEIKQIATMVAEKLKVNANLTTAITAAGLMTLNQVGLEAFKTAAGEPQKASAEMSKSADAIVASRAKDDSQGLLGFLKTINKKFSVIYNEYDNGGKFPITSDQQVTGASAADKSKDWKALDERCWEGVIPVECTAASCGTCWIGVIAGEEKLSEVSRLERKAMRVFGYNQGEAQKPFMRLACQAKVDGNVTVAIAPWNGVFGKKVYNNIADIELEPVTTSAKKLRETLEDATKGE